MAVHKTLPHASKAWADFKALAFWLLLINRPSCLCCSSGAACGGVRLR